MLTMQDNNTHTHTHTELVLLQLGAIKTTHPRTQHCSAGSNNPNHTTLRLLGNRQAQLYQCCGINRKGCATPQLFTQGRQVCPAGQTVPANSATTTNKLLM